MFEFFNEIGIIEQLARNRFERVMPDGMTLSQFSVLNHFVRLGGEKSPHQLARAFQVTKGTMTNTLQRLEARGCLSVRPDPADGRGKLVTITSEGRVLRDACIAALGPHIAEVERDLGSDGFAVALPWLRELRRYLDTARDKPMEQSPENSRTTASRE